MTAEQPASSGAHRGDIELFIYAPEISAPKNIGAGAVPYAVDIGLARAGETGVKARWSIAERKRCDILRQHGTQLF